MRIPLIVLLLSFVSSAVSSGVVMSLFLRTCQYQHSNCTGNIIYEHIRMIGKCTEDTVPGMGECQNPGFVNMCVANTDLAKEMPNWISRDRGWLDRCGDDTSPLEAEGFVSGCSNTYMDGKFVVSIKRVCESGNQRFHMYSSEDCLDNVIQSKMLGAETEFDKCAQTRRPYVWRTTHCETQEK